jgi:beta-lactam-binding protein with PASTA domain
VTRRMWLVVLTVALALSVGFTVGYVVRGPSEADSASAETQPAVVIVPTVLGMLQAEAQSVIEEAGLVFEIRFQANQAVATGQVFQQEPPGGVRVGPGTIISVVVAQT